jgi:hypothetical protein
MRDVILAEGDQKRQRQSLRRAAPVLRIPPRRSTGCITPPESTSASGRAALLFPARGARVCHRNPVQENVIDAALGVMEQEERYGREDITPQIRALCATCPHCP